MAGGKWLLWGSSFMVKPSAFKSIKKNNQIKKGEKQNVNTQFSPLKIYETNYSLHTSGVTQ